MTNQKTIKQDLEELAKETKRQYARDYYKEKRQEILSQRKKNRRDNHEMILAKEKAYRASNKDKVKQWNENYWKRRAEFHIKET